MLNKKFSLTSATLKWIAIITMLINHLCYCLNIYAGVDGFFFEKAHWYLTRGAFVIFAFQIAEGMFYTKNRKKYIISIFAFALISEIIYDLCFYGKPFYFEDQNVFFNLGLSALTIAIIDKLGNGKKPIVLVLITILSMIVSTLLNFNYLMVAEAMIVAFYYLRDNKKLQLITVAIIFIVLNFTDYLIRFDAAGFNLIDTINSNIFWKNYFQELHGLLALPLLMLYKGEKGKNINKWFFYLFYPCHLLIIYLLCQLLSV